MLAPLDALSIATAAVQFVDFTSELVHKANEIREAGATIDNEYVKDNTVRLISLNAGLRHRRRFMAQDDAQLQFFEAGLDQVLLGCCNIADELIIFLGKLTAPNASIVKSLKTAFLSYLKKEKVVKLSKQLDSYRLELSNYSLALINEKLEKQFEHISTKLEHIQDAAIGVHDGQRRINEIIAFSQQLSEPVDSSNEQFTSFEQDLLRRHISDVDMKEGKLDLPLEIQNTEAVAAIVVVSGGKGEKIELQLKSSHEARSWERSRPVSIDTTTILCNDGRLTDTGRVSVTSFTPVAQSIVNCLSFYAYRAREEAVAEAHKRTFQWIFKTSPFMDFLRSSDGGCFWVSGKAGSGKSTLMKFIHHHKMLEETLERWSGKTQLIIASYFFWNAGNELQKSQHGLLRSMLLTILQSQRHLIPVAFPEACLELVRSGFTATPQFTFSDYKLALTRILSSPLRNFKICFLLDGADEYFGDPNELVEFLEGMITFPSIKLIISSRPWNVFTDAFRNRPSLRMEVLTKNDIQTYTRDKLTANTNMFHMLNAQPDIAIRFVDDITNRAQGVFLWVILVTRSLLSGIRNADTLEQLERRLDELPSDLGQLYLMMFTSMSPIYRDQAARMFQIMHRSNEVLQQGSLSLLKMWYALEDTLEISIKASQKLLAALDRESIHDTMRRRLASTTNGLIEVDTKTTDDFAGSSSIDSSVQFLHKTVTDFLEQHDIRDQIQSYISFRNFDPTVALLASCIRELKAFPTERAVILNNDRVMVNMFNCLRLIRYLEITQRRPYATALDEVNTVVSNYWRGSKEWKNLASDPTWQLSESVDWPTIASAFQYGHRQKGDGLRMNGLDSFLVLAIDSECILYAVDKTLGMQVTKSQRSAILGEIVFKFFTPGAEDIDEDTVKQRFNLVTASGQIIEQGADPNAKYAWEASLKNNMSATPQKDFSHSMTPGSIWNHCLFYTSKICLSNRGELESEWDLTAERALQTLQLFQIFISLGADLGHGDFSVGKVIALLEKSLFDPSSRVFKIDVEGREYERVRTEYLKTVEVLRQRKAGARVFRGLKEMWKKVQPLFHSSFAESFISFVVGGVVVVFITRWLKI